VGAAVEAEAAEGAHPAGAAEAGVAEVEAEAADTATPPADRNTH
jgi:hypothetical protein